MTSYRLGRAYDAPHPDDGCRVLADRPWPRGVGQETAALRRWNHEAPAVRGDELEQWYREELAASGAAGRLLDQVSGRGTVTLLTAVRDPDVSHLPILRAVLQEG